MEQLEKCQAKGLLYNKKTRRCYKSCEQKKKVTHPVTKKCRKPCKSDKIRRIENFRCVKNTLHLKNMTYAELRNIKQLVVPKINNYYSIPAKLPKTVMVVITTHGVIRMKPNTRPPTPQVFQLPPKMTLTSISSVTPGVCLFVDSSVLNILIKHLYNDTPKDFTKKTNILRYAKQISALFKTIQATEDKVNFKEDQKIYKGDADYAHYLHHNDKTFLVDMYRKTALNKSFSVDSAELKATDGFFNKVNIIVPNLGIYNFLSPAQNFVRTDTESLMADLNEKGVENVILLDLSCSEFDEDLNQRDIRALVRDLLKQGLHGG